MPSRADLARRLGVTRARVTPVMGLLALAPEVVPAHQRAAGAALEIDGRGAGDTPASLVLSPGEHRGRRRHKGYADAIDQIRLVADQTGPLDAELWLQTAPVQPVPDAQILRPDRPSIKGAPRNMH